MMLKNAHSHLFEKLKWKNIFCHPQFHLQDHLLSILSACCFCWLRNQQFVKGMNATFACSCKIPVWFLTLSTVSLKSLLNKGIEDQYLLKLLLELTEEIFDLDSKIERKAQMMKENWKSRRDALIFWLMGLHQFCRTTVFILHDDLHSCMASTFISERNEKVLGTEDIYLKSFCMQVMESGNKQQQSCLAQCWTRRMYFVNA